VNDKTHHDLAGSRDDGPAPPPVAYALRVYPVDDASEVRLADLWATIWRGKWLIAGLATALAAISTLAAFVMTPVYRAQVVVAPVVDDQKGGGLASIAGQLGGLASLAGISLGNDQSSVAESIATLQSRSFTEKFITEHELLPVLFADLWDDQKKSWNVTEPEAVPTLWDGFERFNKSVRDVTQDAQTGLVTLTIDWPDPQLAADWANALIAEVNARLRASAIEQSQRHLAYLSGELEKSTDLSLRAAIYGLMQAEMRNAMFASGKTDFAFRVIDPAVVPEDNVWPNKFLFLVLGFSAGLVLGVFAAFIYGARAQQR
jgi:uncharacterized protein involved in exopolysaccharide biosynthesis